MIVRVPVVIEDSESPVDAIKKADKLLFEDIGQNCFRLPEAENADEVDGYLVDVIDDKGELVDEEGMFCNDGETPVFSAEGSRCCSCRRLQPDVGKDDFQI